VKGRRRRLTDDQATKLVELAQRVEEEPDAFPVLADAILELGWYDARVMPMVRGWHPSSSHHMDVAFFDAIVTGGPLEYPKEWYGHPGWRHSQPPTAANGCQKEFACAVRAAILFGTWNMVEVPWAEKHLPPRAYGGRWIENWALRSS
jgi:hypothetical protein